MRTLLLSIDQQNQNVTRCLHETPNPLNHKLFQNQTKPLLSSKPLDCKKDSYSLTKEVMASSRILELDGKELCKICNYCVHAYIISVT